MQRDLRIDSIKGLLILLVVFGHCHTALQEHSNYMFIYNIIYSSFASSLTCHF